jgi:hypothetical protein
MKSVLKSSLYFFCLLVISLTSFCQAKKQILKSWIKREIYSLPDNARIDDTLYTRYSFQKNRVYISFYPGWNENPQEWALSGNKLTIGMADYNIVEITDSTLTISQPGFRRVILDDENYLNQKSESPPELAPFNNKPLYKATQYITPRYKRDGLRNFIGQNLEGYNIRKAITFLAYFIVKEDGGVDSIQIINGISYGFDAEVINKLKKTSKDWTPAVYKGQPIQTQMMYSIKYLDSIVK